LIVIDRVSITPEYRGRRLSHLLVNAVAQALSPEGIIAMLPMPSEDQRPANVAKLQRHWAQSGFVEHRLGVYVRAAVVGN
jgi:GNAT superfamily N-acetyltransferase